MAIADGEAGARVKFELTEVRTRSQKERKKMVCRLTRVCDIRGNRGCCNLVDLLHQKRTNSRDSFVIIFQGFPPLLVRTLFQFLCCNTFLSLSLSPGHATVPASRTDHQGYISPQYRLILLFLSNASRPADFFFSGLLPFHGPTPLVPLLSALSLLLPLLDFFAYLLLPDVAIPR